MESVPEEKEDENPNVYTQTKNIDFININNLDNEEEVVEEQVPTIEVQEERNINKVQNPEIMTINDERPVENVSTDNMSKIKYATAIRLAKDTVEDIKTAGYEVSLEELDTPNNYQIIIKIQK